MDGAFGIRLRTLGFYKNATNGSPSHILFSSLPQSLLLKFIILDPRALLPSDMAGAQSVCESKEALGTRMKIYNGSNIHAVFCIITYFGVL